jgi:cyanophycinase
MKRTAYSHSGLAFFLIVLTSACGGGSPDQGAVTEPDPSGRLVIIGGGLQAENTVVYQAILDGRSGEGPLCVFPTASADPQPSMESAVARFEAVGGPGAAKGILLSLEDPGKAALQTTVESIRSCAGFYFSGGSQRRIVEVFRPEGGDSPAFTALMERFEAGAVVSGSSAGAAIMTDPMIGGGSSVGALREGIRVGDEGEGVVLEKGLGFLENTLVDQHFLARGRWARLLVAVLATDAYSFGMGIDENTALVVDGDSAWVAGASGVIFFDTRSVILDEAGKGGSEIVLYLLGSGDGVNLRTGAVQLHADKAQLPGTGEPYGRSDTGLFDRWALLHFLAESAVSSDTLFTFRLDDQTFHFLKGPGFQASARPGLGVEDTPLGLSVGPFLLSVVADRIN